MWCVRLAFQQRKPESHHSLTVGVGRSAQGHGCASKPEVVLEAMAEVEEGFAQRGVDLTPLG